MKATATATITQSELVYHSLTPSAWRNGKRVRFKRECGYGVRSTRIVFASSPTGKGTSCLARWGLALPILRRLGLACAGIGKT